MDTHFARKARVRQFSAKQLQFLVGSLLGDAYLVRTSRGFALRINHSILQRAYVDWKYGVMKQFVNSPPRQSGRTYYFRTVSHPTLEKLRSKFYQGSTKVVPRDLTKQFLTPLALAVWVMDDGSREGNQLRINSQSFSLKENKFLQKILRAKLGISSTINRDKSKFRLRICQKSMNHFRELIQPYLIPSMLYKLSL